MSTKSKQEDSSQNGLCNSKSCPFGVGELDGEQSSSSCLLSGRATDTATLVLLSS